MLLRFLRFNIVGALGIAVQLAGVTILVSLLHVHYLVSTAIAIEIAVLHNFAWHERWTWARPGRLEIARSPGVFFRCVAFHAGNGCVSLLGTMALMPFLVGWLGLHYLLANIITITATGLLNFVVGDRLVFGN
jgi:putative flippase GtrA